MFAWFRSKLIKCIQLIKQKTTFVWSISVYSKVCIFTCIRLMSLTLFFDVLMQSKRDQFVPFRSNPTEHGQKHLSTQTWKSRMETKKAECYFWYVFPDWVRQVIEDSVRASKWGKTGCFTEGCVNNLHQLHHKNNIQTMLKKRLNLNFQRWKMKRSELRYF